jgi:hypothetical protein
MAEIFLIYGQTHIHILAGPTYFVNVNKFKFM